MYINMKVIKSTYVIPKPYAVTKIASYSKFIITLYSKNPSIQLTISLILLEISYFLILIWGILLILIAEKSQSISTYYLYQSISLYFLSKAYFFR